jgi:regulator of RNase E activity RraA
MDCYLPVGCGGVAVIPGDTIVSDGVVVILKALADEVTHEGIEAFIKLQVKKALR